MTSGSSISPVSIGPVRKDSGRMHRIVNPGQEADNGRRNTMIKFTSKQITLTALFVALGVVFPIVFHQAGIAGRIFLPMHIPVFLAGIFVGPIGGLIVGLSCPFISFLFTGMPPPYAVPLMSLELMTYGVSMGILIRMVKFPILSLLLAMVLGRLAFALGLFLFGLFLSLPYGPGAFIKVSVITGLPGIALQLILIPLLLEAIQWTKR